MAALPPPPPPRDDTFWEFPVESSGDEENRPPQKLARKGRRARSADGRRTSARLPLERVRSTQCVPRSWSAQRGRISQSAGSAPQAIAQGAQAAARSLDEAKNMHVNNRQLADENQRLRLQVRELQRQHGAIALELRALSSAVRQLRSEAEAGRQRGAARDAEITSALLVERNDRYEVTQRLVADNQALRRDLAELAETVTRFDISTELQSLRRELAAVRGFIDKVAHEDEDDEDEVEEGGTESETEEDEDGDDTEEEDEREVSDQGILPNKENKSPPAS